MKANTVQAQLLTHYKRKSLPDPTALPRGKDPAIHSKMGGAHSRSEHSRIRENLFPLPRIESWFLGSEAYKLWSTSLCNSLKCPRSSVSIFFSAHRSQTYSIYVRPSHTTGQSNIFNCVVRMRHQIGEWLEMLKYFHLKAKDETNMKFTQSILVLFLPTNWKLVVRFSIFHINVGGRKTKKKLPVFHVTLGLGL